VVTTAHLLGRDAGPVKLTVNGSEVDVDDRHAKTPAIRQAAETLAAGHDPGPFTAPARPDLRPLTPEELADPVWYSDQLRQETVQL
jgi:hypothetical protein